jgi:hypothetical protein
LDRKAFEAELRASALEWVRLACIQDWAGAAVMVQPPEGEPEWSPERVQALVSAWAEDNGALVWDHKLRLRSNASVRQVGQAWEVTQMLVGQHEDGTLTMRAAGPGAVQDVELA